MEHLDREQLKALLTEIPQPRNRLMVLTAFHHGLRVSEVIVVQNGINLRDGFLTIKRLKGSLPTTQPYVSHPDPLLDEAPALFELEKLLKRGEQAFPMTRFGAYKLVQRAAARAGIPAHLAHPHILKHSIAMLTIKTAGIENVRQHLGHKSIASTGFYLKVDSPTAAAAVGAALRD
jgi:integrase